MRWTRITQLPLHETSWRRQHQLLVMTRWLLLLLLLVLM